MIAKASTRGTKAREDDPISADIAMHALLVKLHADRGAVELGLAADLYLRGIWTALATCIGPEAAWRALQRAADGAKAEFAGRRRANMSRGPP